MKKTVVITGANSGIGAACAKLFSTDGYNVIMAGRNEAKTKAVAETIDNVTIWTGDLSSSKACNSLIDFAIQTYGRIDTLVNNAGVIFRADAAGTDDDMWRETLTTNLDAPFYLSRAAIPHLIKAKGSIVNISSDWGLAGGKQAAAYCASKGGLVLLTKAMALDHAADKVNINAICPGDVDTPMLAIEAEQRGVDYNEAMQEFNDDSPTGRVTTADEVAALVLYLASDVAAQITGTAIPIDGGNLA